MWLLPELIPELIEGFKAIGAALGQILIGLLICAAVLWALGEMMKGPPDHRLDE